MKAISILFISFAGIVASANCGSFFNYKNAIQKVLQDVAKDSSAVQSGAHLGALNISVFQVQNTSVLTYRVHRTNSQVRPELGPALASWEYTLNPLAGCQHFQISNVKRSNLSTSPAGDRKSSVAVQTALMDLTSLADFVPAANNGAHTLKVLVPEGCANGNEVSVQIQRLHSEGNQWQYKNYVYLIAAQSRQVLAKRVFDGSTAVNLCR